MGVVSCSKDRSLCILKKMFGGRGRGQIIVAWLCIPGCTCEENFKGVCGHLAEKDLAGLNSPFLSLHTNWSGLLAAQLTSMELFYHFSPVFISYSSSCQHAVCVRVHVWYEVMCSTLVVEFPSHSLWCCSYPCTAYTMSCAGHYCMSFGSLGLPAWEHCICAIGPVLATWRDQVHDRVWVIDNSNIASDEMFKYMLLVPILLDLKANWIY